MPGCVDGWDQPRAKFGAKTFADLIAPSIKYAEDGVPVPEVVAGYWKARYRGIRIDPKPGVLHGGSESRKDGAAVGF